MWFGWDFDSTGLEGLSWTILCSRDHVLYEIWSWKLEVENSQWRRGLGEAWNSPGITILSDWSRHMTWLQIENYWRLQTGIIRQMLLILGRIYQGLASLLVLWEKFQNLQMDWMKLISRVEKLWRLAPSNNWQHLCEGNSLQTTSNAIRESHCPKLKWMLYLNRFPSQFIQQTHYKQVPTWNFCRKIILTTNIED